MAKITIEELSGSLKEYLNGLGLTEAQVQELIDKFEDEKIGDISQLSTQEKGSLVGAINELFQSANNGKELIANAIGDSSITADDTFSAMSEAIIEIRDKNENTRTTLANLMVEGGYKITGDEDINVLLELLTVSGISISDIKNIVSGYNHMFVLKNDGSAIAYGLNDKGQLGLGDTVNKNTFNEIPKGL